MGCGAMGYRYLSILHERWADVAGSNWESRAGENATKLAEMCFYQMDAFKTGHEQLLPTYLEMVQVPHYDHAHPDRTR